MSKPSRLVTTYRALAIVLVPVIIVAALRATHDVAADRLIALQLAAGGLGACLSLFAIAHALTLLEQIRDAAVRAAPAPIEREEDDEGAPS
jgi:hypothetical protein